MINSFIIKFKKIKKIKGNRNLIKEVFLLLNNLLFKYYKIFTF